MFLLYQMLQMVGLQRNRKQARLLLAGITQADIIAATMALFKLCFMSHVMSLQNRIILFHATSP